MGREKSRSYQDRNRGNTRPTSKSTQFKISGGPAPGRKAITFKSEKELRTLKRGVQSAKDDGMNASGKEKNWTALPPARGEPGYGYPHTTLESGGQGAQACRVLFF